VYRKILLANDGSMDAGGAFYHALLLARRRDAKLHMLLIEDPREAIANSHPAGHIETGHRSAFIVATLERLARAAKVKFHADVVAGPTVEQVVQYAKQNQVDLLVVGTLTRPQSRGLLGGSLVAELVHRTPCAVLVVKPKQDTRR